MWVNREKSFSAKWSTNATAQRTVYSIDSTNVCIISDLL